MDQLEVLGQLKNPVTSSEIEPAIFRLVAQCLNQLRYRVPSEFKRVESVSRRLSYMILGDDCLCIIGVLNMHI
jgi:hypothetical protein